MESRTPGSTRHLLVPADIPALRRAHTRAARWWGLAPIVAVLMIVVAFLSYVHERGAAEHVLGHSEEVTARVESVQADGRWCRNGKEQQRIEVTWTGDPGPGSGSYRECVKLPAVGDQVQVWVTASGSVRTESPAAVRWGMAGLALALAAGGIGVVAAFLLPAQRARTRLLQATGATALSPVGVDVRSGPRAVHGRITIRSAASGDVGAPAMSARVLFVAAGTPPQVRRPTAELDGPWQLRLEPEIRAKRQLGVLDRPGQRCWVECMSENRR